MSIEEMLAIDFDTISSSYLRNRLRESDKDLSEISKSTHIKMNKLTKIFDGKIHPTMYDLMKLSRTMEFSIEGLFSDIGKAVDTHIGLGTFVTHLNAKRWRRATVFLIIGVIIGGILSRV